MGEPKRDRPTPDTVPADARAEVTGSAENAKGGAVIAESDGRVVYMEGLDSWPEELHGKVVVATGRLVVKPYLPEATVAADGAISQGTDGGDQWVLENASWEVAPDGPAKPAEPAGVPIEAPTAQPSEPAAVEPAPPAPAPPAEPPKN